MQDVFPIALETAKFLPITTIPGSHQQAIQIIDPEFSSVCPRTGLPDYGRIILQYQPRHKIAELKDWKLYLRCFYGVGIMHEPVTRRILDDFVCAVEPVWANLLCDWGARGGLKTVTGMRYRDGRFMPASIEDTIFITAQENWDNMC